MNRKSANKIARNGNGCIQNKTINCEIHEDHAKNITSKENFRIQKLINKLQVNLKSAHEP